MTTTENTARATTTAAQPKRTVRVSRATVAAAQLRVTNNKLLGRAVSPVTAKIALIGQSPSTTRTS